jgi:hypothetical protein
MTYKRVVRKEKDLEVGDGALLNPVPRNEWQKDGESVGARTPLAVDALPGRRVLPVEELDASRDDADAGVLVRSENRLDERRRVVDRANDLVVAVADVKLRAVELRLEVVILAV